MTNAELKEHVKRMMEVLDPRIEVCNMIINLHVENARLREALEDALKLLAELKAGSAQIRIHAALAEQGEK